MPKTDNRTQTPEMSTPDSPIGLIGGVKRKWLREHYDEVKSFIAQHGYYAAAGKFHSSPKTLRALMWTDHGEYASQDVAKMDIVSLRHQMEQVHYVVEKYSMWAASVNEERRQERQDVRKLLAVGEELLNISREMAAAFGEALGRTISELTEQATPRVVESHSELQIAGNKVLGRLDAGLNPPTPEKRDIMYVMSSRSEIDLTDNDPPQHRPVMSWDQISRLLDNLIQDLYPEHKERPAAVFADRQPGAGASPKGSSGEVPEVPL